MRINGFTKGEIYGSYVYFIFAKELLYIGESQKIAFTRWHSHLFESGTLSKKIIEFGNPEIDYSRSINFVSINCEEIRSEFPEVRWKILTQAVEHRLHVLLSISQRKMIENYYNKYEPGVENFIIISNTIKTAPASLEQQFWDFANNYADELLQNLYSYL